MFVFLTCRQFSREALQEQALALKQKQEELDQDRQKFTDAAIKMGLERAALQKERATLEEERRVRDKAGILENLPPTPSYDQDLIW